MCGIIGFVGNEPAAPILLDGLSKLEYRGYDSAGIAVQNAAGKIEVVKAKGRLKVLSEMTDGGNALTGRAFTTRTSVYWMFTIYCFGKDFGNRCLTCASRSAKQIGMSDSIGFNLVL